MTSADELLDLLILLCGGLFVLMLLLLAVFSLTSSAPPGPDFSNLSRRREDRRHE